ncbi:MAG: Coenzyme F420 hydrogenase/dehydrogenase, beta subunit C-terminal domain [Candidatus Krumholzibacteriota bacterium]|nr:Coenzyme F420 hydrogenase/dehydrogenase, beta subunit C-terminal domain [Candidatus Krumholzibacteriota bacterium]
MRPDRIWSFDDLNEEVVKKDLCGKCGGCVSFCSANRIGALRMDEKGYPAYKDKALCLQCGLCYMVCPQTHPMEDEIDEVYNWKEPIGNFMDIFSARSTDFEIRKDATDGGVVTALLVNMLEEGKIDGAIVSHGKSLLKREARVATTREEIIKSAGSHFSELPHLEEVGEGYSNFVPVVKSLHELGSGKLEKVAIVGTPCQINALRKMQTLNVVPSDIVIFSIGLFCMQCFEMERLMDKPFIKQHGLKLEDIARVNIKEDFMIKMKSGLTVHIPLEEIEPMARPACLSCNFFSNDYADISVGGLGSIVGYTSVMVRTIKGKEMMADALSRGVIERKVRRHPEDDDIEKKRLISLVKEYKEMKQSRGLRYRKKYRDAR